MDKKTNYNSIDVIKVCMSVLVVATHTGLFSLIYDKEFANTLINSLAIKVPFFFVASGFLVWYKIGNSSIDVKKAKLEKSMKKMKDNYKKDGKAVLKEIGPDFQFTKAVE